MFDPKETEARQYISPDILRTVDREGIRYSEMQPGQSITVHAKDALTRQSGSFMLRVVSVRDVPDSGLRKNVTFSYEEGDFNFYVHGPEARKDTKKLQTGDLLESAVTARFIPQTDYRMSYFGGIGVGRDHLFDYVNGEDLAIVAHDISGLDQGEAPSNFQVPDISQHLRQIEQTRRKRLDDDKKSKDEIFRTVMEDLETHLGDSPYLAGIKDLIANYSPNGQLEISSFLLYAQEDGVLAKAVDVWAKAHNRHFFFEHPDIRGDTNFKASTRDVVDQMYEDAGVVWPRPASKDLVITLPDERRTQLTAKLREYEQRTERGSLDYRLDARHKAVVLHELLTNGKISPFEMKNWVAEVLGSDFDPELFARAWRVLKDYCETGGRNVPGGTGLPQV